MAGYNGYSMSNNAVAAYDSGLVPFSKLPAQIKKIGVANLKQFIKPSEWHHTSARYNCTYFYNPAEVLATFGIAESGEYSFEEYRNEFAVEFLQAFSKKLEKEGWEFHRGSSGFNGEVYHTSIVKYSREFEKGWAKKHFINGVFVDEQK